MSKDYYKTLGVEKDATKEEIKKAYKKLAKKYHPDINKDVGTAENFKEINEAASVLGDDQKRQQYDQFGTDANHFGNGFSNADSSDFASFSGGFDFDDIVERFFGGSGGGLGDVFGSSGGRRSARGNDLRVDVEVDLEDVYHGTKKHITLTKLDKCPNCDGSGAEDSSAKVSCSHCRGSGRLTQARRTPFGIFQTTTTCPHCQGEGSVNEKNCKKCNGEGRQEVTKKIEVNIPAGIDNDTRLRVTAEGEAGPKGAPPGDLYVFVHVKPHTTFVRREDDLFLEVPVSFVQAALGAEIEIETIDGKAKLKIPSGTQSHTIFRMRGKGLPHLHGYGSGNQNVRVVIEVPKKLTAKQKKILEEFSAAGGDKISKGFFQKLKEAF